MAEKVSGMKYFGKTVYSGITMGKVLVLQIGRASCRERV